MSYAVSRLRMLCDPDDLPVAIGDDGSIVPVPTVIYETIQTIDDSKPIRGQFDARGIFCYWRSDKDHRHDWTGVKTVRIPGVGVFLLLREHWEITCIDISPRQYVLANAHVQVTTDGKHSMVWRLDPPEDNLVDVLPRATTVTITGDSLKNDLDIMHRESHGSVVSHTRWSDPRVAAWVLKHRSLFQREDCDGEKYNHWELFDKRPDLLVAVKKRLRQVKRWNEV